MKIELTERQIELIVSNLSKDQLINFLAKDIETSVDWICEFIRVYVDSEILQNKLKNSFPPIQLELWK